MIEKIKADNPLEDVVSRYVPLQRRGKYLKGLCPFHSESVPSFTLFEDGHFHCFGCGAHGDVVSFLMRIENIDFHEACRRLGARELPRQKAPPPKRDTGPEIVIGPSERHALALAMRVYHARLWALPQDAKPRTYMMRRKMGPDAWRRFGVGWCSGSDLIAAARFLGVPLETLLRSGLVCKCEEGGCREWLAGRLVFPERDAQGVVYLVGRALDDERLPKYLGLAGLPKPLFGAATIDPRKPLVVTEGIMCRYSLENRGLQAVAVMGTGLQGKRAALLKPVRDLWFIPQNDPAGREAVAAWLKAVGHGRVALLPEGAKDVNDLDIQGGLDAWLDTWATWR